MNNEKLLNEKLDNIRTKADALKGLYSLRTLLIDIKRRDLSEQGTRAFFDVLKRHALTSRNSSTLTPSASAIRAQVSGFAPLRFFSRSTM